MIIEYFPNFATNGVFQTMLSIDNCPDFVTSDNATILDTQYFALHSGNKKESKLLDYLPKVEEGKKPLSDEGITFIVKMILNSYSKKWEHLQSIQEAEYNPIANVQSEETFTTTTEHGHTVTNTGTQGIAHGEQITHTGTQGMQHGETVTNTGTSGTVSNVTADNTENSIYGFNSVVAVPSDSSTSSNSSNSARTDNLSEAHTGTDTRTDNLTEGHSGTDTRTDNLSETHGGIDKVTESRIREGNIGVTMTQQLLTAEQSFWNSYEFINIIFSDVDKILTIPIY